MKTIRFRYPDKRLYLLRAFLTCLAAFICGWEFLGFPFRFCHGILAIYEAGQFLCLLLLVCGASQGYPTVIGLPLLVANGLWTGGMTRTLFQFLRTDSFRFRRYSVWLAFIWLFAEALFSASLISVSGAVIYSDPQTSTDSAFRMAFRIFGLQAILRVCFLRI